MNKLLQIDCRKTKSKQINNIRTIDNNKKTNKLSNDAIQIHQRQRKNSNLTKN